MRGKPKLYTAGAREAALRTIEQHDLDGNLWKMLQVTDYPDFAECGNFHIEKSRTTREQRIRDIILEGGDRDPGEGTIHKLVEYFPGETEEDGRDKHVCWMSDTRAEIFEHMPFFRFLDQTNHVKGKRVLINGLGLGMVAHGVLNHMDGVAHIDVVDSNADVIGLVGPLLADGSVTIWHADAYDIQWPAGTRWDAIWHDIWPNISDENLEGMEILRKKYRKMTYWQGFWQIEACRSMARVIKMMADETLPYEHAAAMLSGVAAWRLGY